MIELINKDVYFQKTKGVFWRIKNENRPDSMPGRNIGIQVKEDGVDLFYIFNKMIDEPSNGIALVEFKKLKMANNLEEFTDISTIPIKIRSTVPVDENGVELPAFEYEHEGETITAYSNDYDFFRELMYNGNEVVLKDLIVAYMVKFFVTIPSGQ